MPKASSPVVESRKGTVVWDLKTEAPDLVPLLPESARRRLTELHEAGTIPVARLIRPFVTGGYYRPARHVRSFYQRIDDWREPAVIAIKGSEIWSKDIKEAARAMTLGRKTLNHMDTFVMREFRVPLVYLQHEALGDSIKGVNIFRAVSSIFGCFPRLPLPLGVIRWPDVLLDKYRQDVYPLLSKTACGLVERNLTDGLAAYVYFYRGTSERLKHCTQSQLSPPFNLEMGSSSWELCDRWVTLFTQILASGYFPCVVTDWLWGSAVQDQNACMDGGFVDIDSMESMDEEPSLFAVNLLCSLQMLSHCIFWLTSRQTELSQNWIRHGNGFGTGLQHMALLPQVWKMVEFKFKFFQEQGFAVDQRLTAFLGGADPRDIIQQIITNLPPSPSYSHDDLLQLHTTP